MTTISIRQADGWVRVLAVSRVDARLVRDNPALIEAIDVLGCVDVSRDGREEWGTTGPAYRDIPADVRALLRWEVAR